MATHKFYKHKDSWKYLTRPSFEVAKDVDAHALDTVLGVTGAREVVVMLPAREEGTKYHVRIDNGFIVEAHLGTPGEHGVNLEPITEFFARDIK